MTEETNRQTEVDQRKAEAQAARIVYCEHCGRHGVDRRDSDGNYFCSWECIQAHWAPENTA